MQGPQPGVKVKPNAERVVMQNCESYRDLFLQNIPSRIK